MRILVFSERQYGCGASIAATRLAQSLGLAGHEVHYVYRLATSGEGQLRGVSQYRLPVPWERLRRFTDWPPAKRRLVDMFMYQRLDRTEAARWMLYEQLESVVRRVNPDVVNIHNNFIPFRMINRIAKRWPVVWTLHDAFAVLGYNYYVRDYDGEEVYYYPMPPERLDVEQRTRLFDSDANLSFVSPSYWLKDIADEVLKGRKSVYVVRNGIPKELFFPSDKKVARAIIGVPEDGFTLLFLASDSSWQRKNATVIFEAMRMLKGLPIRVVTVGARVLQRFPHDPRLKVLSPNLNVNWVRNLYSAADVFCMPSIADNLPNTVTESLLCGCPVLGANRGGVPEMVQEGINGWLFDPYRAADLARRLRILLTEPERVHIAQHSAVASAIERFSPKRMADGYLDVFQRVRA